MNETKAKTERELRIAGLRAVCDYLDAHPDVPAPYVGDLNVFAEPGDLGRIARGMGGFDKEHGRDFLSLTRDFPGGIKLSVNFDSEAVCERVVTGTKEVPEKVVPAHTEEIIEWRCPESLLSLEGD